MATNEELLSLHRYFIWANRMRTHFDELLATGEPPEGAQLIEARLYMSYWYAGLYVVIEGWRELHIADAAIDALLASPNVPLLKQYRHGTFHYQRKYDDKRFLKLIEDGKNVVAWVRDLNNELGRYFLATMRVA